MNNERGGGQASKMAALRRTDYVVHKKKNLVHTRTAGRKDIYLDSKKI